MTRKEVKEFVQELFAHDFVIELEVNRDADVKYRVMGKDGEWDKFLITYTRNEHGMFTASDVSPYTGWDTAVVY